MHLFNPFLHIYTHFNTLKKKALGKHIVETGEMTQIDATDQPVYLLIFCFGTKKNDEIQNLSHENRLNIAKPMTCSVTSHDHVFRTLEYVTMKSV